MAKAKSIFTILLFVLMLLGAVLIPTILLNEKEEEAEAFPEEQKIRINNKTVGNTESNAKTRKSLENDYYFRKFATSPSYNYVNVKQEVDPTTGLKYAYIQDGYLRNMIINFIFNYQLTNTEKLRSINYETGYFCMAPLDVKVAMEELYYSQIGLNEFMKYVPEYIEFVKTEGGNYCFNFDKVSKMNDSEILLGINKLSVSDQKNVTAEVYVYKFYTMNTDKEESLKKSVKKYIDARNYQGAANIVENNLNGSVEHKKIVFKVNSRKSYFEYKLLYSSVIK